jgi:hypothetical protein
MNKKIFLACAVGGAAVSLLAFMVNEQGTIAINAEISGYTLTLSASKNKIPSSFLPNEYFALETDVGNDFFINTTATVGSIDENVFCTFPSGVFTSYLYSQSENTASETRSIRNLLSIQIACSGVSSDQGIFLSLYSDSTNYGLPSDAAVTQYFTTTVTSTDTVLLTDAGFGEVSVDTFFNVGLPTTFASYSASIVSLVFTYAC